jgi:transposase
MDKDVLRRLVGIDGDTVGRICDRVVADELDPGRLDGLYDIGVDEISWKKHHNYLLGRQPRHEQGRVGRGRQEHQDPRRVLRRARNRPQRPDPGRVDGHGPRVPQVGADGRARPAGDHLFDPFHVVKLGTDALDAVRRDIWQQLRRLHDPDISKKFTGARWALMKDPEDLTTRQAVTLTAIKRHGGDLWRAYQPDQPALGRGALCRGSSGRGRRGSRASRS